MQEIPTNDNRPVSGFERYDQLLQKKQRKESSNEHLIVPAAIKILAWISLICGTLILVLRVFFRMFEDGTWIYGFESVAASVFLFGFSAIVKAAYKYLNE